MVQELLSLEKVKKTYDMGKAGKLTVLKDINLTIKEGDFVSIVGPSGSGKSTMMNLIGALDLPTEGTIKLKGKKLMELSESELAEFRGKTIGFIFQTFNLIPTLSALENVMLPQEVINISSTEAEKRSKELLEILGLGERIYHTPSELSGGQQQRVAIARSMSNDPDIILADEPTGNLDSKTGRFVMDFLTELNKKGKTIILITHDTNLMKYSKRTIYLKDGKIIKDVGGKQK